MLKHILKSRCQVVLGTLLLFVFNTHVDSHAFVKSKKGWLGVSIVEMTPSMKKEYELGSRAGLLITFIEENSPAEDAGLWEDDVILSYNGSSVELAKDLTKAVRKTEPGSTAKLRIFRDGEEKTIEVKIAARKEQRHRTMVWSGDDEHIAISLSRPRLGVSVHELNEDLASYFSVDANKGVLISKVHEDTPAEKAGLKAGDVITKVDDEEIRDQEDLIDVLRDYEDGDEATVEFVRKGKLQKVVVELEGSILHNIRINEFIAPRLRMERFERDRIRHRMTPRLHLRDEVRPKSKSI
ncbi:MAG: PDZ domain-containing protein [bacterium]